MTSEEFWKDDPKLFSSYQKAYIEKAKRENEKTNTSNWLQGAYIYEALEKSLTKFGLAFIAGKGSDKVEGYSKKPYDLNSKEEESPLKRREEQIKNQKNLNFWARIKK